MINENADANTAGNSTNNGAWGGMYPPVQQPQHVCPACGYCTCCGRRNAQPANPWPNYGPIWYYDPYRSPFYSGTTTVGVTSTSNEFQVYN